MSDVVDIANDHILTLLSARISVDSEPKVYAKGVCLFCHEKTAPEASFCDEGCQEDYERIKEAEKRNGKKLR